MDRVYFDEVSYISINKEEKMDRKCTVCGKDLTCNLIQWKLTDEYGNGDLCKSCWDDCWERVKNNCVNKEDKKVKKEIDYEKIKYWDVKVVKVKGRKQETKCEHSVIYYKPGMEGYRCCKCEKKVDSNGNDWGNFVNGEDLDKIKFPCFCSFVKGNDDLNYGMIIFEWKTNRYTGQLYKLYKLLPLDGQHIDSASTLGEFQCLDYFIELYQVKILKGKVILFKEEGK